MKIPPEFKKNNKYYKYIKQCNEKIFLYEVYSLDKKNYYYKETFDLFDLGLIKPTKVMEGFANNPENVIIL